MSEREFKIKLGKKARKQYSDACKRKSVRLATKAKELIFDTHSIVLKIKSLRSNKFLNFFPIVLLQLAKCFLGQEA